MMGTGMAECMRQYQNALEDMNNEAVEYVRGIPVVKTFQQSIFSFKSFHDSIMRYKNWAVNYTCPSEFPCAAIRSASTAYLPFSYPRGFFLQGMRRAGRTL